jgi:signal peptidase I
MENQTQQGVTPEKESIWDLLRFALIVLVIALGVRFFIAQPFVVSGTSMVPTFEDKNYLIVDQLTYRFREPERGDVIIFHPPFPTKQTIISL